MLNLGAASGAGTGVVVVIYLAVVVVSVVGMVKIVTKAGYSGWFVLLAFVPLVNLVMYLVFAFSDWPVHKELRQYQGGYGPGPGGYPAPPWPAQPPPGYGPGGPQFPPSGWAPAPGGSPPPWPGGPGPQAPGGSPPPWPDGSPPAPGG